MQFNRGQVGETMTWVVATVIIIVMAAIFLFAVSLISNLSGISSISYSNSSVGSEEMLFAVLSESVVEAVTNGEESGGNGGKVLDLIKRKDYLDVNKIVRERLNNFRLNGINCDFVILEDEIERVEIVNGGEGEEVKLDVEGSEVSFKC